MPKICFVVIAAVLAVLAPPAAPQPHVTRLAAGLPVVPGAPAAAPEPGGRCTDRAGTWLGMRWRTTVNWHLNGRTIPAYLGAKGAVLAVVRSAATTVDTGRNDCGLPADLAINQRYVGETRHTASVTKTGGCGERDGTNTVSFGDLNAGLLAVTCIWWYGGKGGGRSVEADILIDDTPGLYFTAAQAGCTGRWDLEGTVTHEFGHVFGLGHVAYGQHGELTMTDGLPDCSTAYRGLGLGDYLALKQHYG